MIVTFDVETYYYPQYSLRKMSTVEYVLDRRYQTILAAIQVDDNPCRVFVGHQAVAQELSRLDWDKVALLAHNTKFDAAVLAWRFGCVPALYLDTLSMARATTHWVIGRSSLEKVSEYLGLPPKGHEVVKAIGKRLEHFTPSDLDDYAEYCRRDAMNCRAIFDRLRPHFSTSELRLIDLVVRMHNEPQVQLNPEVLTEHLQQVRAEKAAVMARVAHIDKSVFSSQLKFKALLEQHGVDVPTKISPATGEEIPALAKNDREFKELCMDESQPLEVQALLAARINAKSTLEETRTEKLLQHSLRDWCAPPIKGVDAELWSAGVHHGVIGSRGLGWAGVPLKYYGARTGRLSGDGGENWQNFKRGSRIKEAIVAPPGYRIVHRDASQIEARLVAWLARCRHLIDAFLKYDAIEEGEHDVYTEFASSVYQRPVTKADKLERFVGKTGILGLGYGCGPDKFRHMLFVGNGGISHNIDEHEARRIVYHYRSEYPEIPQLWEVCGGLLASVAGRRRGHHPPINMAFRLPVEPGFDALWLPNQMCIAYPSLRYERTPTGTEMFYDSPYGGKVKIYGAKCTENISQALARIIVTDIAVRLFDLTGRHPFLSTHDSLDYCVPVDEVEWWDRTLESQFAVVPSWAEGLPLASEGGFGLNLLAAERMENK